MSKVLKQSNLREAEENQINVMVNRPLNAIPPYGLQTGDWGGLQSQGFLKIVDKTPSEGLLKMMKNIIVEHHKSNSSENITNSFCGNENDSVSEHPSESLDTLQQLALHLIASTKRVDVCLSGAKTIQQVDDLVAASMCEPMQEEHVWECFDAVIFFFF